MDGKRGLDRRALLRAAGVGIAGAALRTDKALAQSTEGDRSGYDFGFDLSEPENIDALSEHVKTYVNGMESALQHLDKSAPKAIGELADKVKIIVNGMTIGYLQIYSELFRGVKNKVPAIDADAMHLAVVEARDRSPRNAFLVAALEHIRKEVSDESIEHALGYVPLPQVPEKGEA